jgi:hypothetical protein
MVGHENIEAVNPRKRVDCKRKEGVIARDAGGQNEMIWTEDSA